MASFKTTTVESLLGVLSLEPMSGYEMRKMMEHSTANFWTESFGQIYPALRSMLEDGLVEVLPSADDEGHPAKKVYRITECGRAHLQAWLGAPVRHYPRRHELLLKLFFSADAPPGQVRAHIHQWRSDYRADLARYQQIARELPQHSAGHPGLPYFLMTVRYGVLEAEMVLRWCDEVEAQLEQIAASLTPAHIDPAQNAREPQVAQSP
jgi:DNA-binding PadR family transcriptional regulator